MKSAALVSFAFLISSIGLPAQTAGQDPSQSTVFRPPPPATTCPISLRAQHGATGGMLQADKGRPKGLAQLLHLTLISPDSRRIVSARVRVRGLSGRAHTTQALSGQGDSASGSTMHDNADVVRSLTVRFTSAPGNTATGDLWIPGMTAVLTIDLNSVAYADGSTQSFTARDACRVAPDLKMLVADR
jgi:hypothetical protein